MDVHPTKNVSIGIDPYPHGFSWNIVQYQETGLVKTTKESLCAVNAANI
jgi:hypothetical protein